MNDTDKDIFEDAKLWDFPSVNDTEAELDLATNALNRPKGQWKFEAPEEEQEITPLTAQDIEAIRASAYQEGLDSGHKEGFEKGYAEGLVKGTEQGVLDGNEQGLSQGKEQAKAQIDEQSAQFTALISQLHAPLARVDKEVQKELVVLAKALASAVIKVELQQNQQVLLHAIEEGIKALPIQESHYHILLNPSDIQWLTAHFGAQHIAQNNWHFIANEDLLAGGCKIQTQNNAVDVSIEKRCDQVFTQLLFDQGVADDPRAK